MKIAVIGAGLSGSIILRTLLNNRNSEKISEIYIFESRSELGKGMPYEEDSLAKKLNSRADVVSVKKENPDDFIKWIIRNYVENFNSNYYMVSRTLYGRYLNEHFSPYFENKKVTVIMEEIKDLEIRN